MFYLRNLKFDENLKCVNDQTKMPSENWSESFNKKHGRKLVEKHILTLHGFNAIEKINGQIERLANFT